LRRAPVGGWDDRQWRWVTQGGCPRAARVVAHERRVEETEPATPHARALDTPVTPKGRRTREALLSAGEVVAEREGLSGLSVAAVTDRAGVAKGTFYLYFLDREALFAQLAEPSMRAIGMTPARISARLVVALTSEAALIEMEAARKVPGARKAIRTMLSPPP
jgi:AcrR family transcriptional regulator